MRRSDTPLALAAFVVLLLATTGRCASAATIVLDDWSNPLAANPCLPRTAQPIVFFGRYCDGVSCPPDPLVDGSVQSYFCDQQRQLNLSGVLGGDRYLTLSVQAQPAVTANVAQVMPAAHVLAFTTTIRTGANAVASSYFGGRPNFDWHLDVSASTRFHTTILGDVSPAKPAYVVVQMFTKKAPIADYDVVGRATVTQPGDVSIPFGAFTGSTRFRFDRVDEIDVTVMDCDQWPCAGLLPARTMTVGPLLFDTDLATSAPRRTWGQLKAAYR